MQTVGAPHRLPANQTAAWRVQGFEGLECYQASGLVEPYGKHCHDAYSIGLIDGGLCGSEHKGGIEDCPVGSACVINPEQVHSCIVSKTQPLSYRMIYIDPALWGKCLTEGVGLPYFRQYTIFENNWVNRLHGLYEILAGPEDLLAKESSLVNVLGTFTRSYGKGSFSFQAGSEPVAVRLVRDYLHAHYRENISIEDLTGFTHLNRAYLIRSFKEMVGLPPYAYLLQVRVEQAKKLLIQGLTPAQAALEVGFVDQSHLNRHFKAITGLTPGRYATGHYRTSN